MRRGTQGANKAYKAFIVLCTLPIICAGVGAAGLSSRIVASYYTVCCGLGRTLRNSSSGVALAVQRYPPRSVESRVFRGRVGYSE